MQEIENFGEFNFAQTVEEKKVILFPSFLQHSVCKNESHEDRISVAFNIT